VCWPNAARAVMGCEMDAEIAVRSLKTREDVAKLVDLHQAVWPESATETIPIQTYLDISLNGGILLGAFEGERLVGYVLGVLGIDEESPGTSAFTRLKHCSHTMGVDPDFRNRGVALRLKVEQRNQALRQGLRLITWTVDPLLGVNANLNLCHLGAVCHTYYRDYYGSLRDTLNRGIPSDRFRMDWWITSQRVVERLGAFGLEPAKAPIPDERPPVLNPAGPRRDGLLIPPRTWDQPGGSEVWVEIPHDFQVVKRKDMDLALEWRNHTRDIFERLFALGYHAAGFVREEVQDPPRSYYRLSIVNQEAG